MAFPDPTAPERTHRVGGRIPPVELADNRNRPGPRRPGGEVDAATIPDPDRMGTESLVQSSMSTLGE